VNTRENARLTFDQLAEDKLQDMIDTNFQFYKQITDDPEFTKHLFDFLFERYRKRGAHESPPAGLAARSDPARRACR